MSATKDRDGMEVESLGGKKVEETKKGRPKTQTIKRAKEMEVEKCDLQKQVRKLHKKGDI